VELRDANKPSIDPRRLVRECGKQALAEVLAATGYVPQSHALGDMALALRQYHPILFGGPRGSGKTSLGEALAQGDARRRTEPVEPTGVLCSSDLRPFALVRAARAR